MVESVGRGSADAWSQTYDRRREASALADGARNAVAAAAAAGAGALGLGTIVTIAASTAAADVTGIILASVIAALGFFIIPAKRTKAKAEMRRKIADVRARLSRGAAQAVQRRDRPQRRPPCARAVAPYSRFVRAEGDKLRETDTRLTELRSQLNALRQRVDTLAA